LTEEDAMSKLWTLDLTLQELGFSSHHIQPVLIWLCANAAAVDSSASIWGLQEAIEWLALNHTEGHTFSYEEQIQKRAAIETPDISRPCTLELTSNLQDYPEFSLTHYSNTHRRNAPVSPQS
jgi:ATP-dependent RNA helicase DHX29